MAKQKAKQKAVAAIQTIVEAAKELVKAEEAYFKSQTESKQKGKKCTSKN